ncbi:glycosyltransferase [Microbacterium sp. NPDC019599]|uniref:glycosyltransferase family 2 protein n=1 Tax=Microbacterium sp. NPDC019599 TaxID=3154690 RepID=UPI0033F2A086
MTVDILIPFWGDPGLLFDTVDSVFAQTDDDWTLTVIDDAYPDETVPARFAAMDDPRVTYVRHEHNEGIVAGFRECVARGRSEWLVVLGCDDLLHPRYVELVHRTAAAHPGADIIQPGVQVIDSDGRPSAPLADRVKRMLAPSTRAGDAVLRGEALATSLTRGNWLYWPSLAFRTATIQRHDFRDDLPIILDLAILLDIAFDGGTLVFTPELAFSYRRHSASASQTSLLDGRRFSDERRYYGEIAARSAAAGWRSTARAARWRPFSRLHAATELPRVLRHGSAAGRRAAFAHILG